MPNSNEPQAITVRPARATDTATWFRMRHALWPDAPESEHREEIDRYFAGEFPRGPWEVLLAEAAPGRILGFAEVSIRPYAEGCTTSRVAYLEGWYVREAERGRGVGRALVEAAADWGRARGCAEFASDAEADNEISRLAHRALGFADVGLVRCFRRDL